MKTYRDIVVMPTQELLHGMGRLNSQPPRGLFRGGPVFPWWPFQIAARHCRGPIAVPRDRRPRAVPHRVDRTVPAGIWCGPVSPHFGHMIADFGGRLAEASRVGGDLPLVFSVGPPGGPEPQPFFWGLLAHHGVAPERTVLVGEPTRFGVLHVPRQAERIGGPGPRAAYLDLLDTAAAALPTPAGRERCLFVSRARYLDGRLAAEGFLADAVRAAGGAVMEPEAVSVAEQIAAYRSANAIVFSEGSAVHALQLLGRVQADVGILSRRPGFRIAANALRPRVRSLRYWNLGSNRVHGLNGRGRPQWDRAMAIAPGDAVLEAFRTYGLDLTPYWDAAAYEAAIRADLERWIAYNAHWNHHPRARAAIAASLAEAGIALDVETAWATRIF